MLAKLGWFSHTRSESNYMYPVVPKLGVVLACIGISEDSVRLSVNLAALDSLYE